MIRGNNRAISKLKSGDVAKMPKTYCWRLLNFAGNLPEGVELDLHYAIHRFQMDVSKARYGREGAFYDAIARSTNLADELEAGVPNSVSLSTPGVGEQIYNLWRDDAALNPDSRMEAIRIIASRIADTKQVPHRHIPHEQKIEYLRRLPSKASKLSNTPFYDTVPTNTSVSFEESVPESDLTNAVIKSSSDRPNATFTPEMHYSHYGNNGSVDLFAQGAHLDEDLPESYETYVLEMKSAGAIHYATGANEIIQQFNKMREYFFAGIDSDDLGPISDHVKFELAFTPSKECIEHVLDYEEMYRGCLSRQLAPSDDISQKQSANGNRSISVAETVSIRLPDPGNPISIDVFRRRGGPDPADGEEYKRYLLKKSPRFHDRFWEVFEQYQ